MKLTHVEVTQVALGYASGPHSALIEECRSLSMLHQETLAVLNHFARCSRGCVLELGAYIGGSTVAINKGLDGAADPLHFVVEPGGSYAHPALPSQNILEDLKKHIAHYQLRNTHLLEGWSNTPAIMEAIKQTLNGRKIDVLFVDSDGQLQRDLDHYMPLLSSDCMLVFDDYLMIDTGEGSKSADVRVSIAKAVDRGIMRSVGTYLWGTWAGQLTGDQDIS